MFACRRCNTWSIKWRSSKKMAVSSGFVPIYLSPIYLLYLVRCLYLSIHQFSSLRNTETQTQEFFKKYWIRLKARGVHIAQPMNRFYDWVRKANRAKHRGEKVGNLTQHTATQSHAHACIHTCIHA